MTPRPRWTPLAVVYLLLAIVGLVGTWGFNLVAFAEGRDYFGDWVRSGPSVLSLTVDVLVVLVVAAIVMVVEGRRVGLAWWAIALFVVLMPLVAVAFSLPLFLAVRERRLAARRGLSD